MIKNDYKFAIFVDRLQQFANRSAKMIYNFFNNAKFSLFSS